MKIASCHKRRKRLRSRSGKPRNRRRATKRRFNTAGKPEKRQDVYERITARIVAQLEQGVRPWAQPWKSSEGGFRRPLRYNGVP